MVFEQAADSRRPSVLVDSGAGAVVVPNAPPPHLPLTGASSSHPMQQHLGSEIAAHGNVELTRQKLNYVSSRSRRWAISAHWFGNLLSLLSGAAVLSTIATLSSIDARLILPTNMILAIVVSEAVITVLSLGGCFLKPLAIRSLNSVMQIK
jgi:hypothetical protein